MTPTDRVVAESAPPFAFLRFLHLEDSTADAELVANVLRQEWPRCEIVRAETRDEFVGLLEAERFDLIVSDFSLPRFDGLSALTLARERDPTLPFIFVSGTIGEDNAVKALQQGATDYVIKDRMGRLIPAIRRALEQVRDRQKRRLAEDRLRESQERFQQLAERSGDVFWFASLAPERFLYVSPAYESIWGRPAGAAGADPRFWEEGIHPEDLARVRESYERCTAGESDRFEEVYRVIRPDGTVRWVLDSRTVFQDASGSAARISGVAKDITERRLAAQQIRDQAELLDKARDAIVVCDLERRILFWNHGAERIFGWTAAETVGKRSTELFSPDALADLASSSDPFAGDEWHGEVRLHDKLGRALVLESSVTVIRDESGRPKSYLIISTDITQRKELEQQLRRTQRLESIGTLAGGIAHDLNNVLAPILMAVNLLQAKLNDSQFSHMLGILETSAQHGAGLVRQLLAFARGAEGDRVRVDLGAVIRDVVSLLQETSMHAITIRADVAPDLAMVLGNTTEFGQALMNLSVNARDAMPSGGMLTIRARNVEMDDALAGIVPDPREGTYAEVVVEDTGSGIPPEIIDRIFDPFFTTKSQGKGTGLGLSTVMGIVKSHGGGLRVESEVGRGTRFLLYFPAASIADPSRSASSSIEASYGSGETVLVIDDEDGVREVALGLLEAYGYRGIAARNGREGLDIYQAEREKISAVFVDMMMPGLRGPEVIERLRELNPDVRIVAMSGYLDSEKLAIHAQEGRLELLQKPMTGEDLVRTLRRVLPNR